MPSRTAFCIALTCHYLPIRTRFLPSCTFFLRARKNKTKHCSSGASVFESHLCAISQAPLCLDGSQYAYGFRQGHGAGRRRWLIHLQVHLFKYMYADACMHLHMHAHIQTYVLCSHKVLHVQLTCISCSFALIVQGGAWCATESECYGRQGTGMGTSHGWTFFQVSVQ